ncbi:MAG: anhydro-N-acetylmuramic acid kinase [Alphaproteobacteria bacterium]|nr:anhydro-N-acetylmuramic acid kinase [Alphaproteobacteria bacterium]
MEDFEAVWALGLMSGTSMDGIDAALVCTDGERVETLGPTATRPYTPAFREKLRRLLGKKKPAPKIVRELTELHAEAVKGLLADSALKAADIAAIGFHGHTILHEPERRCTVQIGDGALLAKLTGIDVVSDFRSADLAAGGEGAPLAPLYHLARTAELERPLAVLNLGGVANVTWIGEGNALLAFDTGPGNALLDDWVAATTDAAYDRGGQLARQGKVNETVLNDLLENPYFWQRPPKSLDRNAFATDRLEGLSPEDGAATLTAFTAATVALAAERHFPSPVERWLVTGGGRRNPVLMADLRHDLNAEVVPVEFVGWNGDSLEAEAFAYLAVRSLRRLPLTLPATTGVQMPMSGGVFYPASAS